MTNNSRDFVTAQKIFQDAYRISVREGQIAMVTQVTYTANLVSNITNFYRVPERKYEAVLTESVFKKVAEHLAMFDTSDFRNLFLIIENSDPDYASIMKEVAKEILDKYKVLEEVL